MDVNKKREFEGALMILAVAVIWGISFVYQKTAMEHLQPFSFNFLRCFIGAVFLIMINPILTKVSRKENKVQEKAKFFTRPIVIGGILSGFALFLAMGIQQMGMRLTEASKAGFITSMYIVIVPIIGLFYGKKSNLKMWICIIIASVGMYFLSIKNGFHIQKGDLLILIAAFFCGLQIVFMDIYASKADPIKLVIMELMTVSVLSLVASLLTEHLTMAQIRAAAVELIYTGILSQGVGYTLQALGQRRLQPTVASLILSSTSVFSVIASSLMLGEVLTGREYFGCAVMFGAIILSQVNIKRKKNAQTQ